MAFSPLDSKSLVYSKNRSLGNVISVAVLQNLGVESRIIQVKALKNISSSMHLHFGVWLSFSLFNNNLFLSFSFKDSLENVLKGYDYFHNEPLKQTYGEFSSDSIKTNMDGVFKV